jgi:hypothetical protein
MPNGTVVPDWWTLEGIRTRWPWRRREEPGAGQFGGIIDLRGATYERIVVSWRLLLVDSSGRSRLVPFDRQPYTQLERVLRTAGRDQEADRVYLERRRQERKEKFKEGPALSYLADWLLWQIANYGVRPYRIAVVALGLIAFGGWAFRGGVALRLKPMRADAKEITEAPPVRDRWDSLRVSTRLFLPVELPLASRWEPSDLYYWGPVRFADLAAVLKVFGWVLTPLGVAAVTGVLRRAGTPRASSAPE